MKRIKKRLIAWVLSLVMVMSLLINVGYNTIAEENVVTLPGTEVKLYTYINGVESEIGAETVLKNGDQVKLVLKWSVSNTQGNTITAETDLQYNLAYSGLVLSNSSGSVLQNGIAVGTYSIDESGILHMNITDTTLLSQSDISGGLEIDATINTAGLVEDENGQSEAKIAGQTIKVQVTNPETLPSVSKSRSGDMYVGADGKYYQNFQVVVTDNANADSITFTDTFGGYLSYVSGTMNVDENVVTPTDNGDGTLSYTIANPVKGQQYVISYTAEVSPEAFKDDYWYSSNDRAYYNTATVTNSSGNSATSETFSLGYKNWVSKWGSYDANSDTIFWCITVNAGDPFKIAGTTITDTLPAGTEVEGTIVIKDSKGNQIADLPSNRFPGSYEFSEGLTTKDPYGTYTIEYRTKATSSSAGLANAEYTNTVNVKNTTSNVDKTTSATVYVKQDWMTKKYTNADTVAVDNADGTITWQTVITVPESQTEEVRLSFADSFGAGLDYVANSYSATYNDVDITASSSFVEGENGFTAIFNDVKYDSTKSNKIIIEYKTTYTVDDGATQQDFVNTATITDLNGNTESDTATYRYTDSAVNIVPYKWHTGSNGTTSSWGLQVSGANQLYEDVVAGKHVYIYDTPTLSANGSAIDAGFSVDPGSIKVGGNATDLVTATVAADGKTIVFDITEYIKSNQYNCYYFEMYYTIALDDETVRYMLENGINQADMSNSVNAYLYKEDGVTEEESLGSTVANGTGTPSIGAMLTKSFTYDATTAPYANYVIDINPQKLDLIDGNGTLSLKDVMGKSLQIDLSTIKLVDADTDNTIVGTTTAFDSTTNTLVINNIPDATHCVLSYTVRVNVNYTTDNPTFESLGGDIDVSNNCDLYANTETFSSSETRITGTIQKSSAWADSDYGSIIISKHSGLTVLGGAEFTVTAYKMDDSGALVVNPNYATEYANKGVTIGSFSTESNGKKTVNLLFDILYKIEETQAPAGYAKTNTPIYVIIPGQDYNKAQEPSNVTVATAVSNFETANNVTVNELSSGETYYVENEELSQYSAQIVKDDQFGNYVAGATFELLKYNDATGNYVAALDENDNPITGTTDSYGRITFNYLDAGNYKIRETVVPEGYVATDSSNQTFVLSENSKTATLYVENTKLFGTWTITKRESLSGKVLPGVIFGLYKDDTLISTATTDSNGQVTFENLELNQEYVVKEEATIDGYILSTEEKIFKPTTATLNKEESFDNLKQSGNIKITKTVKDSNPVEYVQGAVYTLYDENHNMVYDDNGKPVTATTDASGVAKFTDLRYGKYYVRETVAPEEYVLDTEFYPTDSPAEVNSNGVYVEISHTNKEKVVVSPFMSFKFKKNGYDENGYPVGGYDSNGDPITDLAGAEFGLYQDGTLVDRAISDANGYVYFLNVTTYDDQTYTDPANIVYYNYTISEVSAPYGYIRDTQGISFTAEELSNVNTDYLHQSEITTADKGNILELPASMTAGEYSFDNHKAAGKVVLKKIDATTYNYQNQTTLAGARYAAYKNGSTTPSAVATSGDNGLLTFTGLEYGATYEFKEIQAPEGYTVSDDAITVTIGVTPETSMEGDAYNIYVYENDLTAPNTYTVKDNKIALNISKQSLTGTSEVHGAKLKLTDAQGNVIDSWTSTISAHEIDSKKLKVNTIYTLTETAAPDGYGYSESISFKIADDGDIEILTGSDENAAVNNNTHTVVMKDKAIGFKLAKVDKTSGKRLTGATLQLLKADGTTVLNEWTSSNSGDYTIDSTVAENIGLKVPSVKGEYTEYIFRETKAPSGYYIAEDIHFYIDYSGDVYLKNGSGAYVAVQDNRIIMQDLAFSEDVVISKIAIAGGPELPGASLTIIDKSNNDAVVETWISEDTAKTIDISKFVNGHTYELIETGAPDGYAYSESVQFTINDEGKVEINGSVQDGNLVTMTDAAISVTVNKKDEAGAMLPGAVITLYDKNGKITDFTSSNAATDIGEYLTAGKTDGTLSEYKLVETTVPFGYKKADDVYFAIDSKGDVHISTDLGQNYSKASSNVISMKDDFETITISKYDLTNSKEIDGAKLKIVESDSEALITNWTSSKTDGPKELNVSEFFEPNVTYKLVETTAPYGYEIAESIEFYFNEASVLYVKEAGEASFTARDNDTIRMIDGLSKIYISKVDATNSKELPGAHLVIKDTNGVVKAEWDSTTDKYEIEVLDTFIANADYTLTETIAPYGYDIAESITFRITKEGVVQVKSGNSYVDVAEDTIVMKDNVKSAYFSKVDATNSDEIIGAELNVTNSDTGALIDSWESEVTKHNIPLSKFDEDTVYTLTEITAPYGYEKAESINFKIDSNGNVLVENSAGAFVAVTGNTVVMEDSPQYIYISKVDMANKEELPGASLKITHSESGAEVDSWTSSTVTHKMKVVEFNVGEAYVLTETTAPNGYEIAENIIFRVNADGTVSVKSGDSWNVVDNATVVMEDEVKTTESTETTATTTETTATTTETTETTAETTATTATTTETDETTTENSNSGGLDDPSDGSGTPGSPDDPTTATTTSTTDTPTTSTDTSIRTGDDAPINMVFILMILSGFGIFILGRKKKQL